MNTVRGKPSWCLLISVLMISMFALAVTAQRKPVNPATVLAEDTAINPHDFTTDFYIANGINPKYIIDRRTGTDLLSVYGWSSNPTHSSVRVIATLPSFGPGGEILFWYPLGELNAEGFTDDKIGSSMREQALANPLYVFPIKVDNVDVGTDFFSFNNTRQASLVGYDIAGTGATGVRLIVRVNYTAKAHDKESAEMIKYMLDKNGAAVDGMPIISSMQDLEMFAKHELISMEARSLWDNPSDHGTFALAPVILDPTHGAIATDAFLLMATVNGTPLPSEEIFATQFGCLKKSGMWCGK